MSNQPTPIGLAIVICDQIIEDKLRLSIPGQTMGETVGISKNSKGHLFVYSRTVPGGVARGGIAAMCSSSTRT